MATWRLAESLKKLREQINQEFPDRSKASDGSIGDAAHSSRTSDHNPNEAGVVCAIDITSDPRSGCTGDKLAAALIKVRDPRIKYIIWNKRIIKAYKDKGKIPAWTWQKYTGPNAHSHHVHISVAGDKKLYDSKAVWKVDFDIAIVQLGAQLRADETSDDNAIQHSEDIAVADSPASQPSVEPLPAQPLPDAVNAPAAQTNEAGSAGVIIQPNALDSKPAVSGPFDEPIKIVKDNSGKLANWLVSGSILGTVGGFWKNNSTLIIVFFIAAVVVGLSIYFVNRYMKLQEARLKADPSMYPIEFVKGKQ
jgi:hypothetical protein